METSSQSTGPLDKCRSAITTNSRLVQIRHFVSPPSNGRPTQAKMKIGANYLRTTDSDSILDTLDKSIDITIIRVFTMRNDVPSRMQGINRKIRLKQPEFLNPPLIIQNLSSTTLQRWQCTGSDRIWDGFRSGRNYL